MLGADPAQGGEVPIGRPLDNARLYVVDADLRAVPLGMVGELCIGGAGLAQGYAGRALLTAARFIPDPFSDAAGARLYRSGDLVRWRSDMHLEYLGRVDNQVKIRGYRIEPGEIEACVAQHTSVDSVIVTVVEASSDKRLVCYVVCKVFDAQVREDQRLGFSGLQASYLSSDSGSGIAKFDVSMNLLDQGDVIQGTLNYAIPEPGSLDK